MTTQVTTQSRQQSRREVRTRLVMTAITLAAISVLVLRQVRQGGEETTAPVTGNTAQRRTTEGAIPMGGLAEQHLDERRAAVAHPEARTTTRGGMAELYAERATAARNAAPAVYIVESQERAQAVLAGIENVNAFRATQGEPPLVAEVMWFDSADAEVSFWAAHEARHVRQAGGAVSDLRHRSVDPCLDPQFGTAADIRDAC